MWDKVIKHYIEILYLECAIPFSPNYEIHDYDIWIWQHFHKLKTIHEYVKWWTRLDLPKVINSSPRQMLDNLHTHGLQYFSRYIKQHMFL